MRPNFGSIRARELNMPCAFRHWAETFSFDDRRTIDSAAIFLPQTFCDIYLFCRLQGALSLPPMGSPSDGGDCRSGPHFDGLASFGGGVGSCPCTGTGGGSGHAHRILPADLAHYAAPRRLQPELIAQTVDHGTRMVDGLRSACKMVAETKPSTTLSGGNRIPTKQAPRASPLKRPTLSGGQRIQGKTLPPPSSLLAPVAMPPVRRVTGKTKAPVITGFFPKAAPSGFSKAPAAKKVEDPNSFAPLGGDGLGSDDEDM